MYQILKTKSYLLEFLIYYKMELDLSLLVIYFDLFI